MSLAKNTLRLALSALVLLSGSHFSAKDVYARGPILPVNDLTDRFEDLKDDIQDELDTTPGDKDACRDHSKKLKNLAKQNRRLRRLIRNKTTQLRQNPDFNSTTDDIIKLQNQLRELRDFLRELNRKRRQAKRDCRQLKAAPDPVAADLVQEAETVAGVVNGFRAELENEINKGAPADLPQEVKDALERGISDSRASLSNLVDKIRAKLNEYYGTPFDVPGLESRELSIQILQDILKALEADQKRFEETSSAYEEATAEEEVREEGNGEWIQLCPKNLYGPSGNWIGTTFVPCSELE